MDEVEGLDVANVESWIEVYSGSALTTTISTGLTAPLGYRFKIRAVNEQGLEGTFSSVALYYAAPLPP